VTELRARLAGSGDNAGKVMDYQVVPGSGKTIVVPLEVVGGQDEFIEVLIGALRAERRTVV
jgi:hypothetical protein